MVRTGHTESTRWFTQLFAEDDSSSMHHSAWALGLFTLLLFCQLWPDVAGFTLRGEDILALLLLGRLLMQVILTGKLLYRRSLLTFPLVLWCVVLLLGVGVTLLSPFDSITQKNALVNGVRLTIAISMFFVVYYHPADAMLKVKTVLYVVLGFSLVTTAVALLQVAHWECWLPFRLPVFLTAFKEGANTQQGREVFALYLGDTGAHAWSAALAMQTFLVWLCSRYVTREQHKWLARFYFVLLILLLIRISVRNSILGLLVAIICVEMLRGGRVYDIVRIMPRVTYVAVGVGVILFALMYWAPDTYYVERVRQVIPHFENGRLVVSRASNIYGRLDYWVTALRIFLAFPLLGGGFYSYYELSKVYGPPVIVHAHNSYLQTSAELGLVGIGVLFLLIGSVFVTLYHTRTYFSPKTIGALWWEFVTGSFIFLTFSMVFSNALWSPNYIAFRMVILGILTSLVWEQSG
jgi:O-antigen ligase